MSLQMSSSSLGHALLWTFTLYTMIVFGVTYVLDRNIESHSGQNDQSTLLAQSENWLDLTNGIMNKSPQWSLSSQTMGQRVRRVKRYARNRRYNDRDDDSPSGTMIFAILVAVFVGIPCLLCASRKCKHVASYTVLVIF